jgi:hypothetical protein
MAAMLFLFFMHAVGMSLGAGWVRWTWTVFLAPSFFLWIVRTGRGYIPVHYIAGGRFDEVCQKQARKTIRGFQARSPEF